jgi:hypothetical protein
MTRLREILAGPDWSGILAALPGYQPAAAPGGLLVIEEALPWWRRAKRKVKASRPSDHA